MLPLVGSPQPKRSWQELPVTVASGPATAGNTDLSRTIVGPPVKQVKREGLLRDWQSIPLANTSNGLAQSDPANKSQQRKVSIGGSHWQELALSSTAGNKVSSKYQENGMDERRILEVLAEGCKCKNNCLSAFKASEVIAWCKAFHLADDTKLRMCLFSLYHPEATEWSQEASLTISGRSSRTQLEICGSHICVESFCRLLGMSRKRFYKLVNGEPDLRTKESGTRPTFCPKQAQVDEFFRDLYQSAAEPPAGGLHFSDELIVAWLLYCLFFSSSLLCYSNFFYLACQVVPESPGDLEAEAGITETLKDWCALSSPVEFVVQNCGSSVHALRRYLPHGTPTDLYWQYLAWHEGRAEAGQPLKVFGPRSSGVEATEQSRPASWTTFWRVYTIWFEILRPRAKSDHGQCQTCFELQTDMYAKHFTPQQKLEKAHAWRVHLQHQYLDRQIYWSLRHASKIKWSNILTIIIDSMDKKKTVWPKWAFDRPSKEIEKLGARPRVVITAALAHGYTTSKFLAPDELSHGADAYCEVLCQVVQETVSQAKNGHVGAFCAYMVAKQLFHTVTLNFLMVGHTHEDVDQVFPFWSLK